MDKRTVERMLDVQDVLRTDIEYQSLIAEHDALNAQFLEVVEGLEEWQKAAILNYLGLLTEMHTKMLMKACE